MFGRRRGIQTQDTRDGIRKLGEALQNANAVVIGAGSGLSASAGLSSAGERFEKYFGDFSEKYGFSDMYSGGFYPYETLEEYWAYWSRLIYINRYELPPLPVYENLLKLLEDKDYFVLTSNADHQFQKAGFDKKRIFYTQGDYGLWQCSKPCHFRNYDNKSKVIKMVLSQGFGIDDQGNLSPFRTEEGKTDYASLKMHIPSEMVPYCSVCGEPMTMNLRFDETFVEDDGFRNASERYSAFLREWSKDSLLLLELGVGTASPGIIKYPFWKLTADHSNITYACVNDGEAVAAEEIRKQSICLNEDIGDVLEQLLKRS
ncbi:MAG: Sir2 silent information regulator family NAD-dependent deacetylase [Blautia sp.]|nr:Sir2 silent information regulator family NAD-dependent deacetylase [Blautia sp.]